MCFCKVFVCVFVKLNIQSNLMDHLLALKLFYSKISPSILLQPKIVSLLSFISFIKLHVIKQLNQNNFLKDSYILYPMKQITGELKN